MVVAVQQRSENVVWRVMTKIQYSCGWQAFELVAKRTILLRTGGLTFSCLCI